MMLAVGAHTVGQEPIFPSSREGCASFIFPSHNLTRLHGDGSTSQSFHINHRGRTYSGYPRPKWLPSLGGEERGCCPASASQVRAPKMDAVFSAEPGEPYGAQERVITVSKAAGRGWSPGLLAG